MSDQYLRLIEPRAAFTAPRQHRPIGRYLVENGTISNDQLVRALELQLKLNAPVGEILIGEGWADGNGVQAALAEQYDIHPADLIAQRPNLVLCSPEIRGLLIRHRVIPWMRLGQTVLIATARPDLFDTLRPALKDCFPEVLPVLASEEAIVGALCHVYAQQLAQAASTRVKPRFSCRNWRALKRSQAALSVAVLVLSLFLSPQAVTAFFSGAAILTLLMFLGLRVTAFLSHLISHGHITAPGNGPDAAPASGLANAPETGKEDVTARSARAGLPKVSVLVPLFREREIASALVQRLSRLTYPKALLDVILVLEESDHVTRQTLLQTDLPPWMRVLEVPAYGGLTTKPRAMNYALDFCKGDIIGVWDAEDAPVAEQIEHVAARFARAPDDVVCLQGILDFYNPRSNWLARCFTIEYASWFRIILPGIARLGLVVPLGGTTLFFRRDKLEELGGWDAHNVTEDADLGVRLCRAGYRTELIETVTYEEANCRAWPWVKQRSRWLKGFMVTYLVHMRSPSRLLADLGPRRFLGFQAFFLGTIGQFLLAPVLWSFWLITLGLPHPISDLLPSSAALSWLMLFVVIEILTMAINMTAVSKPSHRHLIKWVPTMMFYFPLGALAAYKALYELLVRPFFWDKTQHGHTGPEATAEVA